MSNVNLTIGGRNFTIACADGEEAHISGLGRMIDERLRSVDGAAGQSEARMLLFAALLLADDVHDARNHTPLPSPGDQEQPWLDQLAHRLENLAERLEQGPRNA